jgi:hypothetical protein
MPTNTEGKEYFISRIPEASYDTPVPIVGTNPKNYWKLPVSREDQPVDYEVRTADDSDVATGSNFARNQYITEHDARLPINNMRCDALLMPLFLYSALGAIASSSFSGGDASAKRHLITPASPKTVQQLPPYTLIEQILPTEDFQWPSFVLDQLDLSGDATDIVRMNHQWIGSGRQVAPSAFTPATHAEAEPSRIFFYNTQSALTIADAGGANPAAVGCKLRNWGISIQNNHQADDGYLPQCNKFVDPANKERGIYRARCLRGRQVITLRFTVEAEAGSTFINDLKIQKPLDWSHLMDGPLIAGAATKTNQVRLHAFLTRYSALRRSQSGNILRYEIESKVMEDSSGNTFEADCQNAQASYTV